MRIFRSDCEWWILRPESPQACRLLDLASRHGYRVKEICGELRCSGSYLHRVFLRDIGRPPKEWLKGARLAVARQMLALGEEPGEIARRIGFSGSGSLRRELRTARDGWPLAE